MRIIITAKEAIEKGIWDDVADIAGYNVWALNEGMDEDEQISLTEEQAKRLGLIKR